MSEGESRYRAIFEDAAVSMWEADYSRCKSAIDDIKARGLDFKKYIDTHREFLEEAVQMIKVLDVNTQSLKLFGAKTKEELIPSLHRLFLPESFPPFGEVLVAIAEGERYFETEGLVRTLDGRKLHVLSTLAFPKATSSFDRVLVTVIDISDRRRNEESIRKLNEELERKVAERTDQLEQNIRQLTESELKFQKAFQASAAGIAITRLADSTYVEVNDTFVEMTGYSRAELIGHSSVELGMIVNLIQREEALQQVRELGSARHMEMPIRHKSGKVIEILSAVETIVLGGERYAIIVTYDISERKKTEEQLRKSNELFFSLFENNPASLVISRLSDGRMIHVNESFLHLCGFSGKEQVIGKTASELKIWHETAQRHEILRAAGEKKKFLNLDGQIRTSKGETKWVSTSILPIEVDGHPCLLEVTVDITELKLAELQLQSLNSELEAFSYSVSHDLRAPVRSLIGYSSILDEDYQDKLDEEGRHLLEVIRQNAARMNSLIDKLLEFSRMGKEEMQLVEIDTQALVRTVVSDLNHGHRAEIRLNGLLSTCADSALLTQVWINLISNAIKYSSKRPNPVVEIGSTREGNETCFYVKDNGAGFDMKYAGKLFGVFQRLHKASDFEGIGIGLALVKRIIARHGGRVWAEGKANEGATFYFCLPEQ